MSSIGLNLESKKDSDTDSDKQVDWGMAFSLLKNRGFSHNEILNLSYPQFNAYMKNTSNPLTYSIVVPYLGTGEEKEKTEKISSKEELLALVADMNKEFS